MNLARTRGNMLSDKRDFVDRLADILSVMDNFESCKYACSYITDQEYVKLSDDIGGVCYLNVTAFSEAEILRDICKLVANENPPFSIIHDTDTKRKIAHLFR